VGLARCTLGQSAGLETVTPLEGFPEATITIFPVALTVTGPVDRSEHHRQFADAYERRFREKAREVAGTLGLLLEEKGYDRFEVTGTRFQFPAEKAARKERAKAFGTFVSGLDLKTDYALCTELTIHIEKSLREVYSVIVDTKGNIVWEDSQRPGDPDFDKIRPGSELWCCELARRRLTPVMGLDGLPRKQLAADKKEALRKLWAKEHPAPSELAAMEKRLQAMKQAGTSARILIYPTRVGGDHTDVASATRLSGLLNEATLCRATAARTGPVLEGGGWPNEAAVLWVFARAAREYARQKSSDSDYVLFADYWLRPRDRRVHAVHFVVCNRDGDWVIVDLQNSHKEGFQRINPKTLEDCDRLVLHRLRAELR
jgi:hypothetical protein